MAQATLSKLTLDKWRAIQLAAEMLYIRDYHLASVIAFETAESFSPLAENPLSGAIGLIQFTAVGLTSIKGKTYTFGELKKMTFDEQLFGPVVQYLRANGAERASKLSDVYMAILAPKAIRQPMDFVLYSAPHKSYTQNKGLDPEGKGYITKGDATDQVYKKLDKVLERLKTLERER
jgi:hypothetical protein